MFIKHEAVDPLEFDGLKIVDCTAGQENSSSFAEITVPAGVSHKLSWSNRSHKYYYVVKGEVTFDINEDSQRIKLRLVRDCAARRW